METCDIPISNVHIFDIIKGNVPKDDFVYSDTAYYAQPHRKLAIIHNNYKYIYNKATKVEELYDIEFDPDEHCNIISRQILDVDRNVITPLDQVYFYPRWEESEKECELLKSEFRRIWKTESRSEAFVAGVKKKIRRQRRLFEFIKKFRNK